MTVAFDARSELQISAIRGSIAVLSLSLSLPPNHRDSTSVSNGISTTPVKRQDTMRPRRHSSCCTSEEAIHSLGCSRTLYRACWALQQEARICLEMVYGGSGSVLCPSAKQRLLKRLLGWHGRHTLVRELTPFSHSPPGLEVKYRGSQH